MGCSSASPCLRKQRYRDKTELMTDSQEDKMSQAQRKSESSEATAKGKLSKLDAIVTIGLAGAGTFATIMLLASQIA